MTDLSVSSEEMPEWLNVDFFCDLLSISWPVELKSVKFACAKGDNFASKIYRVELFFADGSTDGTTQWLIVKSRPIGTGFSEEFTKKFQIFPKEIEMYENVDLFEKIFHVIGHTIEFAPKCLKVTSDPTDILIIEDLSAKGYQMAKKSEGLKVPEVEAALKKLAKFHAASAVHHAAHGTYDEKYSRGIYNNNMKDIFDQHYEFNFSFVINEFVSTWPNLDKRVIDKMKNWRAYILDELIRCMAPKPQQFSVLCHGDAWLANMLFRYDDEGRVDCQFIDFQQSVYTSPAIDLISLIFTSAETESKLKNFEHFVKFYHEQLVESLATLNYAGKIPTLKELYMDVLDRGFLGVWHCFAVLPTCLVENVQESSSDNLLGADEEGQKYKEKIFNNERYRKHMTDLLTYFDKRGFLDLC